MTTRTRLSALRRSVVLYACAGLFAYAIATNATLANPTNTTVNLQGSLFETVGNAKQIDPHLLYSVALVESARRSGPGIAPSPWTLRVVDQPGYYGQSQQDAIQKLRELQQTYKSIDIGIMQVNTRWHGHRVNNIETLLEPETGLRIGAIVLKEAIQSAPNDLALGIGRYYTWSDNQAARRYGQRVLHIYNTIR